jgi:hypothetical protein
MAVDTRTAPALEVVAYTTSSAGSAVATSAASAPVTIR